MELTKDAQRRLDGHLKDVSRAMRDGGKAEDEISIVVDSLREQFSEMALSRTQPLSAGAIGEIICDLESPDSYAEQLLESDENPFAPHRPEARVASNIGNIALYTAIGGIPFAIAGGVIAGLTGAGGFEFASLLLFVTEIAALVMGLSARASANGKMSIKIAIGAIAGYFALVGLALLFGE